MRIALGALLLVASTLPAQQPQPPKSLGQLRDLAKQAKNSGDLEAESNYICQAAIQDTEKYGKKCDKAKEDVAKTLDQFNADLSTGRAELSARNYSAALNNLGKITFGPSKVEAQELMLLARLANGTLPPEQASNLSLAAANAAYLRGDFGEAEAWLKKVQSPAFQAAANHLQTNIDVYRDTMKLADALTRAGNFKGAAQKYEFAATIRPNGPGRPLAHLREAMDAQQKADQAKAQQALTQSPQQAQASPNNKPMPPDPNSARKIKGKLPVARREDASAEIKDALRLHEEGDKKALEDSLREGIAEFYASQFAKASEAMNAYLQQDHGKYAGAAHFYLGASLLSQAILADPKDKAAADALRRQGREQFGLAKRSSYAPLDLAVSPSLLALWAQSGE